MSDEPILIHLRAFSEAAARTLCIEDNDAFKETAMPLFSEYGTLMGLLLGPRIPSGDIHVVQMRALLYAASLSAKQKLSLLNR